MDERGYSDSSSGGAAVVERDRQLSAWATKRAEIARLEAECAEILASALDAAIDESSGLTGGSEAREIPIRSMTAEFAATARMPQRTVETMTYESHHLVNRLPQTHQALADGEISIQHAREIAQVPLPPDAPEQKVAEFETLVLDRASLTTARRTRAHARALAQKMFPVDLPTRHRKAREERGVRIVDFDDGMSDLTLTLPTLLAHAAVDRVTQLAKHVQKAAADAFGTTVGDDGNRDRDRRTLDQIRADIAADILLTVDPSTIDSTAIEAIRPRVQVTIPIRSLAGLTGDDEVAVAELDGVGLIDPELVRELAAQATGWDRLFIDPTVDAVVSTDRYRPTEEMRRLLRARDQHCRFPGCRLAAVRCEIDHNHDHARGGPTAICNLCHLCKGHHTLKHPDLPDRHRWSVRQLSHGVLEWISPAGRIYIDEPPARVVFA